MARSHLNLVGQLQLKSTNYKLAEQFKEVITLNRFNSSEQVNKVNNILSHAGIDVQGIRFNQDNTAIEIGFLSSTDRYKALLILESIGF